MQSENITDLAAALAKAQAEIEGAKKDATNPHFKSKYADLGAVWEACRLPLTKNGLSVIQQPKAFDGQMRLVTRIMHSSGQWIEDDGFPLMLAKQDMQGLGSATTYARRYGLMAAVGIAPEDDDGNAATTGTSSRPVEGRGRNEPKPPPPPPPSGSEPGQEQSGEERAVAYAEKQIDFLKSCNSQDDLLDWQGVEAARMAALEDKWPKYHEMVRKTYDDEWNRLHVRMAG